MRLPIFLILCLCFLFGSSQSKQNEYLEAKRQFSLGNYKVALQAFQSLTNDASFGEYASFYYALSALKSGQPQLAEDMLKQVKAKFPSWDKNQEVDYWLAHVAFSQGKVWQGFQRAEELPEKWKNHMIQNYLGRLSIEGLDSAYTLNPDNATIGEYYAKSIRSLPYAQRDQFKLLELTEKFNLELPPDVDLPLVKKDEYAIAVVLPFMYESLETPQTVIRNSIIFDLYQGMQLAEAELKEEDIKVNLFPFDTKKQQSVTSQLIDDGKLNNADVIIGPLYTGPSSVISDFAKDNKVIMINPVSSNDAILSDNAYSLLFKPSYTTQGREAARFAAQQYTNNKKLFIFYETDRDSIIANAYREAIEKEGFFVVRFTRLSNEDAQQIQKDFTEQFEYRLDTIYDQQELDSIGLLPGRIVRTRSLRNERTGRIVRDDEGKEVTEYYEVKFTIQPDSIGHIFAATSSNVLANNFISMAEVRSDSIGIIGYENWLDFTLISYTQLERLQVNFLSTSYYDQGTNQYADLETKFIEKIGREPSEYHVYGYELIKQMGRLLKEHGKYFQQGLKSGKYSPGFVMDGLQYGPYNDNQVVPITTLKGLELINQNTKQAVSNTNEDNDE